MNSDGNFYINQMKLRGIYPARPWVEKPVHIASTPATFEAYVPPEGDGKLSIASKDVSVFV